MPLTKGAMARPLRTFERKLRNEHLCREFVDEQSQDGIEPKQSSDDEPTMGGIGQVQFGVSTARFGDL